MARTLLLDLDGTLVDTVPDLATAVNRLMRTRNLPEFTHTQVASMVGDGIAKLTERAFAAHNQQPDPQAFADLAAIYTAHVAVDSKLYPGVLPVMAELVQGGWRLAVCTNKPEQAARHLLQAVGVLPLLCAVGGGDSFPCHKPDPAHLLGTLTRAAGEVTAAVMLGDNRNDVLAAAGAGVPCIFAAWGYGPISMADGATEVATDFAHAAAVARRLLPDKP